MYGPCKTWIAWFVTEPELLATGEAVALTPPTVSAFTGAAKSKEIIARKYLLYR